MLIQPTRKPENAVALRKESVDRNQMVAGSLITLGGSLSARRAWIEMLGPRLVDMSAASLSARRAWIEIRQQPAGEKQRTVALRKESVDRNSWNLIRSNRNKCRSPQGERG